MWEEVPGAATAVSSGQQEGLGPAPTPCGPQTLTIFFRQDAGSACSSSVSDDPSDSEELLLEPLPSSEDEPSPCSFVTFFLFFVLLFSPSSSLCSLEGRGQMALRPRLGSPSLPYGTVGTPRKVGVKVGSPARGVLSQTPPPNASRCCKLQSSSQGAHRPPQHGRPRGSPETGPCCVSALSSPGNLQSHPSPLAAPPLLLILIPVFLLGLAAGLRGAALAAALAVRFALGCRVCRGQAQAPLPVCGPLGPEQVPWAPSIRLSTEAATLPPNLSLVPGATGPPGTQMGPSG